MREHLYRGKAINRDPNRTYRTDYKNGDWVFGLLSKFDNYGAEMTSEDGVSGIDVDPETVGEYTGLTDKNGKKIFEGHIVKAKSITTGKEAIYLVKFEETSLWFGFKGRNSGYTYSLDELLQTELGDEIEFEAIGNIHDNPESLKRGD